MKSMDATCTSTFSVSGNALIGSGSARGSQVDGEDSSFMPPHDSSAGLTSSNDEQTEDIVPSVT